MKSFPLLMLVVVLIASAGCTPSEGSIQTAIALTQAALPTKTPTPVPPTATQTFTPIPPTDTPTLTPTSTITTSPTPSMFFTEEFDQPLSGFWETLYQGPKGFDTSKVETTVKDGFFDTTISGQGFYAYFFLNQFSYQDVRIDMRAENRGVNNNNVSLICRKNENGWVEFNVMSGGYYDLSVYISKGSNAGYIQLTSGGTVELKQGKATNEYTLICNGEDISMFINGSELKRSPYNLHHISTTYSASFGSAIKKLNQGNIGFSISSFNVFPVIVDIDWLKISAP